MLQKGEAPVETEPHEPQQTELSSLPASKGITRILQIQNT